MRRGDTGVAGVKPLRCGVLRTAADPVQPLSSVIEAYKAFDTRQPGWLKVEVLPRAA